MIRNVGAINPHRQLELQKKPEQKPSVINEGEKGCGQFEIPLESLGRAQVLMSNDTRMQDFKKLVDFLDKEGFVDKNLMREAFKRGLIKNGALEKCLFEVRTENVESTLCRMSCFNEPEEMGDTAIYSSLFQILGAGRDYSKWLASKGANPNFFLKKLLETKDVTASEIGCYFQDMDADISKEDIEKYYAAINKAKEKINNPSLTPFIDEIFSLDKMRPDVFFNLFQNIDIERDLTDLTVEFAKSSLKIAMKRPENYLNGVPDIYTKKGEGKEKLPDNLKNGYQKTLIEEFKLNLPMVLKLLKYTDTDTFNQLMDKRLEFFKEKLNGLYDLSDDELQILSKLVKCQNAKTNKPLTAKEKIRLFELAPCIKKSGEIEEYLNQAICAKKIDMQILNERVISQILKNYGFSEEEISKLPKEKLAFDDEYAHTLLSESVGAARDIVSCVKLVGELRYDKEELMKSFRAIEEETGTDRILAQIIVGLAGRHEILSGKELNAALRKEYKKITVGGDERHVNYDDVIKIALRGDFNKYIDDEGNKIGQTNAKTKKVLEFCGIDYDKWRNYGKVRDFKDCKIKMWDRNPIKEAFIGNRTSCCTATNGANGNATPTYLANTVFNVVEAVDKNGEIVAMARFFPVIADGFPSVIMDTFEINNSFAKTKTEAQKTEIRAEFLDYIKEFTKDIVGKDSKVYQSGVTARRYHNEERKKRVDTEFIGEISSEDIYFNVAEGWRKPEEFSKNKILLFEC